MVVSLVVVVGGGQLITRPDPKPEFVMEKTNTPASERGVNVTVWYTAHGLHKLEPTSSL